MKYTKTNKEERDEEMANLMLTFVKRKSNRHDIATEKVLEWSTKIKELKEIMNKDKDKKNKNKSCDELIEKIVAAGPIERGGPKVQKMAPPDDSDFESDQEDLDYSEEPTTEMIAKVCDEKDKYVEESDDISKTSSGMDQFYP